MHLTKTELIEGMKKRKNNMGQILKNGNLSKAFWRSRLIMSICLLTASK